MFNEQQFELDSKIAAAPTKEDCLVQQAMTDPGESEMTALSDSELDEVSGGFSLSDFGSFFQESGSSFSETNIFFEQSSFAGRDGAGGKTTFILQEINSSNIERAGGFSGSGGGCA